MEGPGDVKKLEARASRGTIGPGAKGARDERAWCRGGQRNPGESGGEGVAGWGHQSIFDKSGGQELRPVSCRTVDKWAEPGRRWTGGQRAIHI